MRTILILMAGLALSATAWAAPAAKPKPLVPKPAAAAPFQPGAVPAEPLSAEGEIATPARQLLLMDYETGQVLYEREGMSAMKPASMAKLMTTAILFEKMKSGEMDGDTLFTVSEKAWRISVAERSASSKMFLEVGSKVRLQDLLRGIIIQSGNDATIVAAEGIAGSEQAFAGLMNAYAAKIGMKASQFRNSSGLPHPEQFVTAYDLALLARHLISVYPEYYRLYAEKTFTWNKITQANRNPLLTNFPGADGLKTGHTAESGYGLVGSALREGRRVIMVVNGLTSEAERAAETARLMDMAFREFTPFALFRGGETVASAEVFGGRRDGVPLIIKEPVSVILRRAARGGLKAVVRYEGPLAAPVRQGEAVGTLTISAPGIPPKTYKVHTASSVARMGIIQTIEMGLRALTASGAGG